MVVAWHAPEQGKSKFYSGAKHEGVISQEYHQKSINDAEAKYLVDIANGDHHSQKILNKGGIGIVPCMDVSTHRSKHSNSSQLSGVVDHLKSFNSSLRDDLATLKDYLAQTNARLETVASQRSSRLSTARSRSSLGSSYHSARDSARELHSRSTMRSSSSRSMRQGAASIIQDARGEVNMRHTIPTRRSIKGYRIGHETKMATHKNGFSFPEFGAGAVTESKTQRHRSMITQAEANPIAIESGGGHKRMFLNNMYLEDPAADSRDWQGMFRHCNSTFINRPDPGKQA